MTQLKKWGLVILTIAIMNLLSGCGQTGPLYLPQPKPVTSSTASPTTSQHP